MPKQKSRAKSKQRAWRLVWIYIGLILTSLPLTPDLRNFLAEILSIDVLVNGSLLIFFAVSIALVTILKKKIPLQILPYFLIWAILLLWLMTLIKLPIERVHIPQYGLLSILFFRAFRMSRKNRRDAYRLSLLWAVVAGVLDEFIQYLLPNRYFALRDVWLNAIGSLVGLLSYRFYEWVKARKS